MGTILLGLAFLGGTALVYRLIRSLARVAIAAAEATAASGLAEISARRGDITTLAEREETRQDARRSGRRNALYAVLWLLLLIVPAFLGGVREVYALASLVWLLPYQPIRPAAAPRP
ncbi:hypothetical protein BH24GEM3_BH24GEM3_27550 [soil metagenome]